MVYDYFKAVKEDAKRYIVENMSYWDFDGSYFDDDVPTKDELIEYFNDELWAVDAVTGNGPNGVYYIYNDDARRALFGNEELLINALEEFGGEPESYKRALLEPNYADVTIRCDILGQVLDDAIGELLAEGRFPFAKKSVKSRSPRAKKQSKPKAKRR